MQIFFSSAYLMVWRICIKTTDHLISGLKCIFFMPYITVLQQKVMHYSNCITFVMRYT